MVLTLDDVQGVDHVVIMEDLTKGQRIAAYRIEAEVDGEWKEIASGKTVGHKRIHKIDSVETGKLRFVCTDAIKDPVTIRKISAY